MSVAGRYPTWVLLLAAVTLAVAAVLRFMTLDRRSNPRRLWFMLLAAWLAVIGLAGAGVFTTRNGQRITPMPPQADQGLLIQAAHVAPPGRIRQDLQTLMAAVEAAISDNGQGPADENSVFAAEDAVNLDCRPVPAAG